MMVEKVATGSIYFAEPKQNESAEVQAQEIADKIQPEEIGLVVVETAGLGDCILDRLRELGVLAISKRRFESRECQALPA